MTTSDLTPRWGADDDWTSFLLLIVPVAQLPVPASEVEQAVRRQIESDAALFDLVTVGRAPAPGHFKDPDEWGRALVSSLLEAAMPQGRFLAPRAVLTVIIVGEHNPEIQELAHELQEWESLKQLSVRFYGCRVVADPGRGGVAAPTVRAIVGIAAKIMAAYEQHPELAIDERTFLAEAAGLVERGLADSIGTVSPQRTVETADSAPSPASPPPVTTVVRPSVDPAKPKAPNTPKWNIDPVPPIRATVTTPGTQSAPMRPSPVRPIAPPQRESRPPVFHRAEEIVMVDGRSPLRRLRGSAPTDAEAVDWLSEITNAVSLAYLVFVPDEESSRRKASREYRRIALSLDQMLGTVVGDALTGRPMRVAVEVLTAVSPLHKHGTLRPAGELVENDLPKAASELYDHARTVDALLSAAQRTARAFHARRTQVMSLHYIFLSGLALPDANTSGTDWDRLLHFARATWVEVGMAKAGDSDLPSEIFNEVPDISPSPYGFHVVSHNCDVPALVRVESAALYAYETPAAGRPMQGDAEAKEGRRRRWWSRNSTPTG